MINLKKAILIVFLFCAIRVNAQDATNSRIYYITDADINFNQLIGEFKNKIIYVDIWASWCQPCRWELQQKKVINAFAGFAAKNDIIILYICADSDGSKWKSYIASNKLAGYHFLINKAVGEDFHTTYAYIQKRNGIMKMSFYLPRHIIIDKTGMVADSMAERQGSPKLYTKLNELLKAN